MKKVFIFVPAFGNTLTATTFLSTHQISQILTSKSVGASVSTLSFPDIAELRSMVATIWHDTMPDIDYLLFIDADMGVDPNMILDMLVFDEPIVGTIYPQRKLPVSWAGSGEGTPQSERRGNFMKVEGVGMGCTLIHKSVVQTILAKYPELADYRIDLHPAAGHFAAGGGQPDYPMFREVGYSGARHCQRGLVVLHPVSAMRRPGMGGNRVRCVAMSANSTIAGTICSTSRRHRKWLRQRQRLKRPQGNRSTFQVGCRSPASRRLWPQCCRRSRYNFSSR